MIIIGVDEAGYGAIAGPLVVAAVAYHDEAEMPHIEAWKRIYVQDSKKLKPEYLEALAVKIKQTAMIYEVITVPGMQVDALGGANEAKLYNLALVIKRVVERLRTIYYDVPYKRRIIVDGHATLSVPFEYEQIPKADGTVWQVGAASILAKVTQLNEMAELHEKYPRYAFKQNKGYPTADHIERLQKYGPCKQHRRSTRSLAPWRKKPKGRE